MEEQKNARKARKNRQNRMKKFKQKILKNKVIKYISFFLIVNFMIFTVVCTSQSIGRPNAKAKVFLNAAATLNIVYIFPIYKIFGWDNLLAQPFCGIRNKLYSEGLKRIPKDDGERELWWFVIKFTEYDKFVLPIVNKFVSINDFTPKPKEFKKYQNMTEEVYSHIVPLATLKIRDKHLISRRYNMLIAVINSYDDGRYMIASKISEMQGHGPKFSLSNSEIDVKRAKFLVDLILKQREYTKKYEPQGWDYFNNNTVNYYQDTLELYSLSWEIVTNYLYKNKLSCDDKYLNLYGETRKDLRNYLYDMKLPKDAKHAIDWASCGIDLDDKKICKLCPNNSLDLLRKDIRRLSPPKPIILERIKL
jgi:hypothetical protein